MTEKTNQRISLQNKERVRDTLSVLLANLRDFDEALGASGPIDAKSCRELLRGMVALALDHVSPPVLTSRDAGTSISRESVRLLLFGTRSKELASLLTRLQKERRPPNEEETTDLVRHLVGIYLTANDLLASPTFSRRDSLADLLAAARADAS